MLGQFDDRPINPSTQLIILKIVRFLEAYMLELAQPKHTRKHSYASLFKYFPKPT